MLTRFNAALAKFCMVVAVIGLCTIVVCVLLQVFGRYVLNDTPTWAEALALVLVLWVTMFGAAVGVRDAGHIIVRPAGAGVVPSPLAFEGSRLDGAHVERSRLADHAAEVL